MGRGSSADAAGSLKEVLRCFVRCREEGEGGGDEGEGKVEREREEWEEGERWLSRLLCV